jgi:hypothetical protein
MFQDEEDIYHSFTQPNSPNPDTGDSYERTKKLKERDRGSRVLRRGIEKGAFNHSVWLYALSSSNCDSVAT